MVENAEIGSILKFIRNQKGLSLREIKEETGLAKSSLSSIENNKSNPTTKNLEKICKALGISVDFLFYLQKEINSYLKTNTDFSMNHELMHMLFNKFQENEKTKSENVTFVNAVDAMKFILEQPSIMGFGGFDINKLSDQEVIDFANELLNQLKLLGYKYKR